MRLELPAEHWVYAMAGQFHATVERRRTFGEPDALIDM